ncbi:hypothetical protein F7C95_00705 [Opitutia bacterium ISCC 51]|nr:hypothetical protein F7C95_00705 [Opitutae bacterium ISCC 51]QXD30496.1 hypothetical protein GA003_00700 [Opitutae bacterium ISCC 52]
MDFILAPTADFKPLAILSIPYKNRANPPPRLINIGTRLSSACAEALPPLDAPNNYVIPTEYSKSTEKAASPLTELIRNQVRFSNINTKANR